MKALFRRIIRKFRLDPRPELAPEFFHESSEIHAAVYTILEIAERYHENVVEACGYPYFPKQQATEELTKFFSSFDRLRTEELAKANSELLGNIVRDSPTIRIDNPETLRRFTYDWLIGTLKKLEERIPPGTYSLAEITEINREPNSRPVDPHHAIMFCRYGSEETGWEDRLGLQVNAGGRLKMMFLDRDDFARAQSELIEDIAVHLDGPSIDTSVPNSPPKDEIGDMIEWYATAYTRQLVMGSNAKPERMAQNLAVLQDAWNSYRNRNQRAVF